MRKLILNVAVSADGFIEGPNGEYDWCFNDQDYGLEDFYQNIDTIFFGRKSYELMLTIDKNPFPDKKKYVFSTTMKNDDDKITLINENIYEELNKLKDEPGKNIWLFGGAKLLETLMNKGFVDELMLSVHPIILGSGKPLFQNIDKRILLALTEAKTFSSGLVQLFYKVQH